MSCVYSVWPFDLNTAELGLKARNATKKKKKRTILPVKESHFCRVKCESVCKRMQHKQSKENMNEQAFTTSVIVQKRTCEVHFFLWILVQRFLEFNLCWSILPDTSTEYNKEC